MSSRPPVLNSLSFPKFFLSTVSPLSSFVFISSMFSPATQNSLNHRHLLFLLLFSLSLRSLPPCFPSISTLHFLAITQDLTAVFCLLFLISVSISFLSSTMIINLSTLVLIPHFSPACLSLFLASPNILVSTKITGSKMSRLVSSPPWDNPIGLLPIFVSYFPFPCPKC